MQYWLAFCNMFQIKSNKLLNFWHFYRKRKNQQIYVGRIICMKHWHLLFHYGNNLLLYLPTGTLLLVLLCQNYVSWRKMTHVNLYLIYFSDLRDLKERTLFTPLIMEEAQRKKQGKETASRFIKWDEMYWQEKLFLL